VSDLHSIFNERGALLAIFGALGGAVRAAALKTTWREGLRVMFIGSATAFGIGALGPYVLQWWIGELPEGVSPTALGTLCSAAFMIGMLAVVFIERWLAGKPLLPKEDDDAQS
jgi:uncharacterized protein